MSKRAKVEATVTIRGVLDEPSDISLLLDEIRDLFKVDLGFITGMSFNALSIEFPKEGVQQ